jgi:hypothetical protein
MPDYDAGFKIVAREAGRELAELGDVHCDEWGPITGEVHAAERLADRAFRARRGGEEFIVYMEAYTRWEAKAPWSVLAKSGLLSERERLPCVSLLYVLLPRGYQNQHGTFRLAVENRPTQQIWFREICLWQLEPQPTWETSPGLMALSPLFHLQQPLEQTVAHAARCIKTHEVDRIQEANLLTVLGIFGRLSKPDFNPFHVIEREAMRESSFLQQIEDEIRTETRQQNVQHALEIRFGKAAAGKLKEELASIRDDHDLSDLLRGAIKCRTLAGFHRLLARKVKSQTAS